MNNPEFYSKNREEQYETTSTVLKKYFLSSPTRDKSKIADIGCGTGEVTNELIFPLFPNIQQLVAFDKSKAMIEFAKAHIKNSKVIFQELDIETQEVPNEFVLQFDYVFSFFCLHWVYDQKQGFRNIWKILKPGGSILVSYLEQHIFRKVWVLLSEKEHWKKYSKYLNVFKPYFKNPESELRVILETVGFQIEVCKIVKTSHTFENMDILINSLLAVTPYYNKIPEEDKQLYISDLLEVTKNINFVKDIDNNNHGNVNTTYDLIIIKAKK